MNTPITLLLLFSLLFISFSSQEKIIFQKENLSLRGDNSLPQTFPITLPTSPNTQIGSISLSYLPPPPSRRLSVQISLTSPSYLLDATSILLLPSQSPFYLPYSSGSWPYHHTNLNSQSDSYQIELESCSDNCFSLTIHLILLTSLGNCSNCGIIDFPGDEVCNNSYFITTNSGPTYFSVTLNGERFDAWCVDFNNVIFPGQPYLAKVVSSYDYEEAKNYVNFPENLDLINYIVNRNPQDCYANLQNVQTAIWRLVDSSSVALLNGGSEECVEEIIEDARENGENYVPRCGGRYLGIIVGVDENCERVPVQVIVAIGTVSDCTEVYGHVHVEIGGGCNGIELCFPTDD